MDTYPVILDVETKYTFRQFTDHRKLGVSVAVLYNYNDNKYHTFTEDTIADMFVHLENASYVIGYNVAGFDLPVLQAYYHGNVQELAVFDMLEDIRQTTGRRYGLNDVASATLGVKKSGHGLQATEWYKAGEIEKIIEYCKEDVKITKQVFEYGGTYGCVYVGVSPARTRISTHWEKYRNAKRKGEVHHTLPF